MQHTASKSEKTHPQVVYNDHNVPARAFRMSRTETSKTAGYPRRETTTTTTTTITDQDTTSGDDSAAELDRDRA